MPSSVTSPPTEAMLTMLPPRAAIEACQTACVHSTIESWSTWTVFSARGDWSRRSRVSAVHPALCPRGERQVLGERPVLPGWVGVDVVGSAVWAEPVEMAGSGLDEVVAAFVFEAVVVA